MDVLESPGLVISESGACDGGGNGSAVASLRCDNVAVIVLKQLWRQKGFSQVELQELLCLVQRMARGGLVRLVPDHGDRRVLRIFLTERGWALRQETVAYKKELVTRMFKDFSSNERTFFTRLLTRPL